MRILKFLPLLLICTPALAQDPPKASKAEVDRVISTIKSDPAKLQQYCTIVKSQNEYQQADEQKNEQKMAELDQRIETAAKSLGPDFGKVTSSELDEASAQALDDLGSSCKS